MLFNKNTKAETSNSTRKKIIGYVAYWDQERGISTVKNNLSVFTDISIRWYTLDKNGEIVSYKDSNNNPYIDRSFINFLKSKDIRVTISIENFVNNVWDGNVTNKIFNNIDIRKKHIENIVTLLVNEGYDGVDIDYENLFVSDRDAFSTFIEELAIELGKINKKISVAVYPKTSEPGNWEGPQSQDWTRLGNAVDEVRIMTYGYSWSTSSPGPLAPPKWISSVLNFAITKIPAEKIIQGIPTYGHIWPEKRPGVEEMWDTIIDHLYTSRGPLRWDPLSQTPWFEYTLNDIKYTVWFENVNSVWHKIEKGKENNIGGIFVWRLGGEDPEIWKTIEYLFKI